MSSEWDDIEGIDGWREKLESLIAEAVAIPAGADVQELLKMNRRLTEFQLRSRPHTPEIMELDQIAEAVRGAVIQQGIDERLEGIAAGGARLARFSKDLRERAAVLEDEARCFRLERVDQTVQQLTETVRAIKGLIESLDPETDGELVKKSERLLTTLQNYRNEVERSS